jgi:hypothetical protein
MKRIFLCTILFSALPLLLFGQAAKTKPRTFIAPAGSWATDLVRAYAFTPTDSVSGDSLKDWSTSNVWGDASTGGGWTNEGIESPGYENAGMSGRSFLCGTLNTSGITNQLTVVQRVQLTTSGTTGRSISLHDRLDTPQESFAFNDIDYDSDTSPFYFDSGTTSADMGDLGAVNDYVTILATYDGDSLRVWLNGSRKAATARTGNITIDSNYILSIGRGANAGSNINASVTFLMTCIWKRVITQTEIDQITSDPYIMFKAASGKSGQVIIIGDAVKRVKTILAKGFY